MEDQLVGSTVPETAEKPEEIKQPKITLKFSNLEELKNAPKKRTRRKKSKVSAVDQYEWELDNNDDNFIYTGTNSRQKGKKGSSGYKSAFGSEESEPRLENHFIIRLPLEICDEVKKIVDSREIGDRIDITFVSNRKAVFRFDEKLYNATLVDLPTMTESYRTTDKKQLLKVADICQMLLVQDLVESVDDPIIYEPLSQRDVVFPNGLAPPLSDVARQRFRQRISYAKVNYLENEVLRLLEEDEKAISISYKLEGVNIDDSMVGVEDENVSRNLGIQGYDYKKPQTTEKMRALGANDDDDMDSLIGMDDFDADLAAELDRGLEELDGEDANELERDKGEKQEGDGQDDEEIEDYDRDINLFGENEDKESDDESEDDVSGDSDDNEPSNERAIQRKLLAEEIENLEANIKRKKEDLDTAPNPIIRKRFEGTIQKLLAELDHKKQQLGSINSEK
ncbi:hypothetical protein BB559_001321 [Furculomyces boomerangus]|uniref:TAFII55 protein conserved region domain-containing protein n=2 Tax=Harpellales TaxID=61421 RepID=A0A2T9Z293_9FUNG|nr:hypothetical protein BB559_001321 [Furculomyces boomerangus]PVZ98785.1 hypothetical protein BB558_005212 [Smittium angustum]